MPEISSHFFAFFSRNFLLISNFSSRVCLDPFLSSFGAAGAGGGTAAGAAGWAAGTEASGGAVTTPD